MHDSGIISLYNLKNTSQKGSMPKGELQLVYSDYYEERTIGYNRLYAAQGVSQQIDLLARIWQNKDINTNMYAVIEEKQYAVKAVQHLSDENNLKVTDLTLERISNSYVIAEQAE